MRDRADNVVIVCSIENVDPMGVHTGDSVTVAPQMSLTDRLYQKLRDQAIAVIRAVGVETGGSNVQFAVNPATEEIVVIEMNPRVSRSSALASKATGFPIAKIAARLAVGYTLDEIPNDITRKTPASFEPTIDYVVVKWPRFAFEKFPGVDAAARHPHEVAWARSWRSAARSSRPSRRRCARGSSTPPRTSRATCSSGWRRPAPTASTCCWRPSGRARPRTRSAGSRRSTRSSSGSCRELALAPGGRRGRRADLPRRRHLRGRVRGRDAVLLLVLGAAAGRARGPARRAAGRDDPRLGPEPDRPGHRVRLLLRARRDDGARVGPRRGDGQLQPGDGLDRLRHLRPAVLRAADAGGRARDRRGRAAGGRDRPVRRPDAAEAGGRAGGRGRAAARHLARGHRPGRGPRPLRRAARPARAEGAAVLDGHRAGPGAARPARASASRCSCGRATCSAAGRWSSSTTSSSSRTTCAGPAPGRRRRSSSTASSRTPSRSTWTRSATARTSGSVASCNTSRRPGSTRATPRACSRRTRSGRRCCARSARRRARWRSSSASSA